MAQIIPPELQAALGDYERYAALLFTAEFGTGTYGLWTGPGKVNYNGLEYLAGGSILEISGVEFNGDGSVAELTISLGTQPAKGITPDILATFYDEAWHMRPVTIQMAMCNPDTYQPIAAVTIIHGQLVQAPLKKGIGKAGSKILGRVVSLANKMAETGNKYRNNAIQQLLDPTDTSLQDIGNLGGFVEKDLLWGQA